MAGRIPENILEDVLTRTDIVQLISGFIPLKRTGRNFKACCPFHHEKTPSFVVSADRQIYHCFGCGESGNAFRFLMRYERLEFPEAVELLAKKAGINLPAHSELDQKAESLSTQVYKVNEMAAQFFAQQLCSPEASRAKEYLLKRGITEATIKDFKLGFAPDGWDALIRHVRAKNISLSLLEKAGLILSKDGGGYYDRFRNRAIFPISDLRGRVLGFGGRVLDSSLPKYMNSPETPVYVKGRNFFGLNLAKDSIRDNDFAVIVEGYLDLILPYQEGLKNIIASLGTALTAEQAQLLKRYTHNVVMIYDPDTAGEAATLRSLEIFLEEDMFVRVASLPKGEDPDLFVRKHGIGALNDIIKKSEGLFDYQLRVLESRYDAGTPEGKSRIFSEIFPTLRKVKNAILRSEYIKKLSESMRVPEFEVRDEFAKVSDNKPRSQGDALLRKKALDINPTERLLIRMMLEENDIIHLVREHLCPSDFQDQRASRIVAAIFGLVQEGRSAGAGMLMQHFAEDGVAEILCESVFMPDVAAQDRGRVVSDCINRLKSRSAKLKRDDLCRQIQLAQSSGDEENINRLMQEFHSLIKQE